MYTHCWKRGDTEDDDEEEVSVLQCGFPIFCQCGDGVDIVKKVKRLDYFVYDIRLRLSV